MPDSTKAMHIERKQLGQRTFQTENFAKNTTRNAVTPTKTTCEAPAKKGWEEGRGLKA